MIGLGEVATKLLQEAGIGTGGTVEVVENKTVNFDPIAVPQLNRDVGETETQVE